MPMKVEINKRHVDVPEDVTTLEQLLKSENLAGPGVAAAVAGAVVPRARWGEFGIEEGMKITVIRAVCGG